MSRTSAVLETLTGAAVALGAVHVARRRSGVGGAGGTSTGEVLPASMERHEACVREGRPTCGGNGTSGLSAEQCPLRYPEEYNTSREEVERLSERLREVGEQ